MTDRYRWAYMRVLTSPTDSMVAAFTDGFNAPESNPDTIALDEKIAGGIAKYTVAAIEEAERLADEVEPTAEPEKEAIEGIKKALLEEEPHAALGHIKDIVNNWENTT